MDNKRIRPTENVNGNITSDSFKTYSVITSRRKKTNVCHVLFFGLIFVLVAASLFVFGYSLKNIFIKEDANKIENENIKTISTFFEKNDAIKVELVTKEISEIFNVPRGIKIVELKKVHSTEGLLVDDIITEISGMEIHCLDDLTRAYKATASKNTPISYKVYRGGSYQTITPLGN